MFTHFTSLIDCVHLKRRPNGICTIGWPISRRLCEVCIKFKENLNYKRSFKNIFEL